MLNIGAGEMVLIVVAALLVLGPQRLPELARAIGKFMREFRRQTDEVRNVVEREFYSMDNEFQAPPTPPVRPGTNFAQSPAPQATPPDDVPHALPPMAMTGAVDEVAPSPHHPPLGLDEAPPAPAALAQPVPSDAPPAEVPAAPAAEAAPSTTPPSSAAVESVGADGLPRLAPLPGTVARNAPKRS
ncbi:twin-arginine translocase TatA/TatE family subunit [Myxococcus sp. K15C18031901]|uniref:Sec-independent protein translocase subunit TatA/TatB n=1 Tax=Myxococcus dinghuensis TaxID=2906761 RepID=UPI0020A7F63A|nr:twin-arginine translocase TatA/TatE family subunit [Myxococcus dinghuensis]MCP3101190.1 twin-arginine translocase TatA/TatE family subunit [Myxococcus dinghuensis]